MNNKAYEISRAIKEQKWLYIEYEHPSEEDSKFWIAIKDINPRTKVFNATFFNYAKENQIIESGYVSFDKIKYAECIDGTTYELADEIYEKIDNDINELEWLEYDRFNINIINYLIDCAKYDQDPFQRDKSLITGVDTHVLEETGEYELDHMQFGEMISRIKEQRSNRNNSVSFSFNELVINVASIYVSKGLFVVAYRRVNFNPDKKILKIEPNVRINQSFLIGETKYSLRTYLDIDAEEFQTNFSNDIEYYLNLLKESLQQPREVLDTKPYLMDVSRKPSVNYELELSSIIEMKENNDLNVPMKAFFGDMSIRHLGKKDYNIYLLDERVNIDQLRVIHNALKNPITYVQGPPGTGKTQTIVNVILSAYYNDKTVLVSSNNNKPIDGIYKKMSQLSYGSRKIELPLIRLGNREIVAESIKIIKQLYNNYKDQVIYEDTLKRQLTKKTIEHEKLNDLLSRYEKRIEYNNQLETLTALREKMLLIENSNISLIEAQIVKIKQDIETIGTITDQEAHDLLHDEDMEMLRWLYYSSIASIKRLSEPKYKTLHEILDIIDEEDRVTQFNKYLKDDKNLSSFLKVFPFIATTNQSAVRLGSARPHFDLVIIDEAGQCSITNSLLPMLRGDRLLLVGDQNQLEPVIVLDPNINARLMRQYSIQDNYNYMNNSILKLMQSVDFVSKYILMRFHYRSHKKIIDFSNKKYYQNQLIIETKMKDDNALYFVDVKSGKYNPKKNTALNEIDAIIKIIKNQNYKDVGIITPFRNQASLIEENCKANGLENIDIGTIHTFQGDEKDIIFISTAITPQSADKTYDWIKLNRELINVATTRPKEKLFIVGDYQEILKRSSGDDDYLNLVDYVKSNGINDILPNPDEQYRVLIDGRKKINTHNETDFLETIAHFMTTDKRYKVVSKVKVSSALLFTDEEDKDYFQRAEFDFILENVITELPELVIELDGPEHYIDPAVKARDRRKKRICDLNGIYILRIKNENIREYEFVRNAVLKILG